MKGTTKRGIAASLLIVAAFVAAALAVPVGADTVQKAAKGLATGQVDAVLDFCDAWQYSSRDPNVTLTVEKCDADSRTLVLTAKVRSANSTIKDAKAKVASKTELKSLTTGACTAAKAADCTDLSKVKDSFTAITPTYDKDIGTYLIAEKLTEKDLPKTYIITFDKDDKLEGAVISFGTATEKLVFNDDGTYIYIYTPWYYGKLKKNNGGYDDFTVYGTTQLGTSTGSARLNYLNDGSVRFGETTTGATCTLGNQTSLWSEVICTAGSAWWRSRYYAGYPIIWQKVGSNGGNIGLIGYTAANSGGATDAATLSNGFQSIQSSGGIGTNAYVYMLFDTFHFDFIALNLDDVSSTFGWPSGGQLYLYGSNWPWAGTSGRHVDYIYYMPQNTTPATMADVVNDYAIFTRGITGITMDTGTLIESNNISLRMDSGVGGCEVQVQANTTLLAGFPVWYECDNLAGTDIYVYNRTDATALVGADLWVHGRNESGGWTWKDNVGNTLTNWNDTDNDGADTTIGLLVHYGAGLKHVGIFNALIATVHPTYYNVVVSPASPQTYPMGTTWFNITWLDPTYEISTANLTFNGIVHQMANESSRYYATISGAGVGTYAYLFDAVDTNGNYNATASANYVINQATGGATLSSSAGWTLISGAGTTLSCAGTGPLAMYFDELAVSNPYGYAAAGTTHGVICNVTDTTNYSASSDSKTLTITAGGLAMTALDETTLAGLTFNVTLFNSTFSSTLTNQTSLFLAFGGAQLPTGDITLEVSSFGYGQRVYYTSMTGGILTNITAYLVATTAGSYVRFHTLTITEVGVQGVLVQINRSISGTTTQVGAMTTDSTGTALFFMNPLVTYTISATKSGYVPVISSIAPSQADYKIYMLQPLQFNITGLFGDTTWSLVPTEAYLTNPGLHLVNFTISNTNNSLLIWGMNISLNNTPVFSNFSNSPAGGWMAVYVNTTGLAGTTMRVNYFFQKSGFPFYNNTMDYYIWPSYYNGTLAETLDNFKLAVCSGDNTVTRGGITWCFPLAIIALFISLFIGAGAGYATASLGGAGLAGVGAMWAFTWMGWLPFGIILALTLGFVGLIVIRRYY